MRVGGSVKIEEAFDNNVRWNIIFFRCLKEGQNAEFSDNRRITFELYFKKYENSS